MSKAKKILMAVVAILASITAAEGQTHYVPHVSVGGHGGMTLSEMAWSPSVRQKFVSGFTMGASFKYAEERHVGLLAEINLTQRGWAEDMQESPLSYKRQLTYIELPVMTHIFFGSRVVKCFFNLGPEFGYMISDKITADFDYANPSTEIGRAHV